MNLELNRRLHERYDKKLYYHGREQGKRPYSGTYIFITDNMGYAAGYSDGNKLYTYTVPFGEDRIFSIKNKKDLLVLGQYINNETINAILRDSGAGQEMDWAALNYISTDDFEMPEDLFQHMGYMAVRLKERQGIDSLYVFNEADLDFKGEIDITTPENIKTISDFYREFTKDKNFLQERLIYELKSYIKESYTMPVEGVADKFAERQFGIPDTTKTQDAPGMKPFKTMTIITPEWMGGEHAGKTEMIPVYLNPRSLQGFQSDVRAISDTEGNLYVAQLDGNFIHGDMAKELGLTTEEPFSSAYHRMKEFQLLHRVGDSNSFGLADSSSNHMRLDTQSKKISIDLLRKVKQKNPQFDYYPEYYRNVDAYDTDPIDASGNDIYADDSYYDQDEDNIGADNALNTKDLIDFGEGVADKYAERQFNIPDPNKAMDRQATMAMGQDKKTALNDPKGTLVGRTDNQMLGAPISSGVGNVTNVYLNPKSLSDFEEDVKAVSNEVGDLFVAQTDADIYHSDLVNGVDMAGEYDGYIGNAYDGQDTITWHRIGRSDDFGFSVSYLDFNKSPENHPRRDKMMQAVQQKNPRFKFLPVYWRYEVTRRYDQENNVNNQQLSSEPVYEVLDIVREEISQFNKSKFIDLPQEFFDRLKLRKFSDEANRSHMKLYKAKDGKHYIISKGINQDIFKAQTLDGRQVAVAVFDDDKPEYFTGYETSQSIRVEQEFQRLGLATALTDFAETIYNKPYKPTNVLSEPMQGFVKDRFKTTSPNSD